MIGGGGPYFRWGATIFALSLLWEAMIYLQLAWPIFHPLIGMAIGGVLAIIGLVMNMFGRLRHPSR